MAALVGVPPEKTIAIAGRLNIIQHRGGTFDRWIINSEQEQMVWDLWNYSQYYVLKVRQIGASTIVCLDDALWTAANDASGQVVRCGIVVDTEVKTVERVKTCASFLDQLRIPHLYKRGNNAIIFPNGSEILGMTAGGRRAGASMTFHRYHLTELPFWRDAVSSYTSLMQALVIGGRVIIETTMGIDTPIAKDLWTKDNDFFKRFFSFEDHEEYRMPYDPEVLDSALEMKLRDEGFTDIEAMTYWAWLYKNQCGYDMVKAFREYPQTEEHSWTFSEGRWIRTNPRRVNPVESYQCPGLFDHATINVYRSPIDGSGDYLIGVDPAGGLGQDRTAIVVIDQEDLQVCATCVSDTIVIDDTISVAHHLQAKYASSEPSMFGFKNRIPLCIIERNGLGLGAVQLASQTGLKFVELQTGKSSRYDGMQYVKRYVESGVVYGPEELVDECNEMTVTDGKFKGKKDLCMAMGFCYNHMAQSGRLEEKQDPPDGWVDMNEKLRKAMSASRRV